MEQPEQHRTTVSIDLADWREARAILFRRGVTFVDWVREKIRELVREEAQRTEQKEGA